MPRVDDKQVTRNKGTLVADTEAATPNPDVVTAPPNAAAAAKIGVKFASKDEPVTGTEEAQRAFWTKRFQELQAELGGLRQNGEESPPQREAKALLADGQRFLQNVVAKTGLDGASSRYLRLIDHRVARALEWHKRIVAKKPDDRIDPQWLPPRTREGLGANFALIGAGKLFSDKAVQGLDAPRSAKLGSLLEEAEQAQEKYDFVVDTHVNFHEQNKRIARKLEGSINDQANWIMGKSMDLLDRSSFLKRPAVKKFVEGKLQVQIGPQHGEQALKHIRSAREVHQAGFEGLADKPKATSRLESDDATKLKEHVDAADTPKPKGCPESEGAKNREEHVDAANTPKAKGRPDFANALKLKEAVDAADTSASNFDNVRSFVLESIVANIATPFFTMFVVEPTMRLMKRMGYERLDEGKGLPGLAKVSILGLFYELWNMFVYRLRIMGGDMNWRDADVRAGLLGEAEGAGIETGGNVLGEWWLHSQTGWDHAICAALVAAPVGWCAGFESWRRVPEKARGYRSPVFFGNLSAVNGTIFRFGTARLGIKLYDWAMGKIRGSRAS